MGASAGTLGLLNSLPDTRGLYGMFVYDVLDDNRGSGPVDVLAKQYSIDCSHEIENFKYLPNENKTFTVDIAGVSLVDTLPMLGTCCFSCNMQCRLTYFVSLVKNSIGLRGLVGQSQVHRIVFFSYQILS